jgi:hypothetical protein
MSWTKEISVWKTLFVLKESNSSLGLKGEIFYATDFAKDLETGEFKTIIAYTTFNGRDLGKGITSLVVTDEQLEKNFVLIEKTFMELEVEKRKAFFESNK